MQRRKQHLGLMIAALTVLVAAGCGSENPDSPSASVPGPSPASPNINAVGPPTTVLPPGKQGNVDAYDLSHLTSRPDSPSIDVPAEFVLFKTTLGDFKVKLFADKAPRTVNNFLENYVDEEFYDGTVFHYVDQGKLLAGGGFTAELQQKPTRGDILNEGDNGLLNRRGMIAMARFPDNAHSANCQFLINVADNPNLDHRGTETAAQFGYCVFGEVVDGLDVVARIASVEVSNKEHFPMTPTVPVVIQSIRRVR